MGGFDTNSEDQLEYGRRTRTQLRAYRHGETCCRSTTLLPGHPCWTLQQRITAVKRSKTLAEVPVIIDRFEANYRVYMRKVGKELDDLTKQNIILQALPAQWEQKMRFTIHSQGREMVYATLRHQILDMVVQIAGPMQVGMDVDAVDPQQAQYPAEPARDYQW